MVVVVLSYQRLLAPPVLPHKTRETEQLRSSVGKKYRRKAQHVERVFLPFIFVIDTEIVICQEPFESRYVVSKFAPLHCVICNGLFRKYWVKGQAPK